MRKHYLSRGANQPHGERIFYRKLWILAFFLFMGTTSASASQSSGASKFNFSVKNATLKEIIGVIEEKSGYAFVYPSGILDGQPEKSIEVKNQTIEKVLEEVFQGTNIGYRIVDNQVWVFKENEKPKPETRPSATTQPQPAQKNIKGTVKGNNDEPIPGATVMVKGTTIGTITDFDGNFNLVIPADSKFLTVSFVGLKTQEITIGSQTNFMISLSEETVGLEEVVVVGYGTQKKESVVGAITQVDNQSLVRSGTQNVTNAITGKLSGVLTIQQTGEPGSDNSEIIIRGLSSWNGSQPLVLVDGVERDFKSIDPNEVNTISVLKDASATAVFGAKGANGVIIVTTRRGIIGKPKMNFSGSYGLEKATRIPDHIDSYTTMSLLNVARMNGGQFEQLTPTHILDEYRNPSTPLNSLRYPNVDWFDLLTHPYAPTSNANFNVSGGTNFIKYFCSLGHLYQNDFFKTYKNGYDDARYWYHRINYRANIDFNLTKSTVFSLNVGGDVGIKNQPNSSPWRNLYATSPARFPAYFPEWVLEMVPDPDYPDANGIRLVQPFGEYTGNPYNNMHNGTFRRYLDTKLFTDLVLEQKLDFITKGLSFKGKASLSTYFRNNSLKADYSFPEYQLDYDKIGTNESPWYRSGQGDEVWYQAPLDINVGGLEGGYYRDMYYEMALSYGNTFAQNHSVSGLALINFQQKNSGTDFAYYNAGVVGRATYDYKHKYLFEVNVGYTGSERFAPGNRFGFFPSGAVGWTISEEEFFKNAVPWMNKLKVRYSDGKVGSDKAGSRWLYMSDYYTDGRGYIREDKGANVTAQWEEARKRDIGVEFGIFNNLISASVDFFDEQREKMLLSPRTVTVLVGNTFKELNKGSLKKHGFEVELEFNKTTASQLNYWVKGIFGFNENRIIYKDDFPYAPDYTKDAGKPLGAQLNGVLLTGTGYFTSIDDIHNNPSPIISEKLNVGDYKYLDYSADGAITNLDKYPIDGSLYPPITYSFSSGFSWKGFDFHLMFQGNEGKFVDFNMTYEAEFLKGDYRIHASQLDYWRPDNPGANHSTLHFSGSSSADNLFWGGGEADKGYQIMIENRFWRDASYLRLKEIYAGYNFNSKLLKNLAGISNVLFYATANNLFTFTPLIEGDPERKDFYSGFYPQMSRLNLGLKFSF